MISRYNPAALAPSAGQSHVVVSSTPRTAYLSGQVALNASGDLVGVGHFGTQLGQVLTNLDIALGEVGATRHDVVKLTVYVVAFDATTHSPALGEHLGDLSSFSHPAATLVSVAGLARPEFLVEIDAIAAFE